MDYAKENVSIESGAINKNIASKFHNTEYFSTSRKECWGFYLYGIGSRQYSGAVMCLCLPLIIERLSAANGYQPDRTTPCNLSNKNYRCQIKFNIGIEVYLDVRSIYFYLVSSCVLIQAIVLTGIGPIGKFGNFKKFLLMFFACVGSMSTILFVFVNKNSYWTAMVLAILGNVCYATSHVFYYSSLSILIDNHNQMLTCKSLLISKIITHDQYLIKREEVANKISSKGFAYSYFAVVVVLGLFVLIINKRSFFGNLEVACGIGGLWWLVFTLLSMLFLKNREENMFPKDESYFTYSFKELYKTLKELPTYFNIFTLLLSWFVFSDSLNTFGSLSILFAQKEMQMSQLKLVILSILAPLSAGIGIFLFKSIQTHCKYSTKKMLTICISLYLAVFCYTCIGLFTEKIGLRTQTEAYMLSVFHGALLGASQSYYIVLFNELLPEGRENEFYTLFVIAMSGSSFFGPLLMGILTELTKSIRSGVVLLSIMFLISLAFLLMVDVKRKNQIV